MSDDIAPSWVRPGEYAAFEGHSSAWAIASLPQKNVSGEWVVSLTADTGRSAGEMFPARVTELHRAPSAWMVRGAKVVLRSIYSGRAIGTGHIYSAPRQDKNGRWVITLTFGGPFPIEDIELVEEAAGPGAQPPAPPATTSKREKSRAAAVAKLRELADGVESGRVTICTFAWADSFEAPVSTHVTARKES